MPHIERYWAAADPEFCDSEGAESFSTLLRRAQAALDRLAAYLAGSLIYVFSHGQFLQAVQSLVRVAKQTNQEKMRRFWGKGSPAIANAELVELRMEMPFGARRRLRKSPSLERYTRRL